MAAEQTHAPSALGRKFAEALATRDFSEVGALLDPQVSFRGLTPNRGWEASSAGDVVADILPAWFEDSDVIDELLEVNTATFADCQRVSYAFRGHNDDGPFVVEQFAYFTEKAGRIDWMRVVCSGFRPG